MVKSENPIFCEDVLKKFMIQDPILSPPPLQYAPEEQCDGYFLRYFNRKIIYFLLQEFCLETRDVLPLSQVQVIGTSYIYHLVHLIFFFTFNAS